MVFVSFSQNMILYGFWFFFLVHLQLAEWIKTSSTESENVSKALCEDISKHCQSTRYVIPDNGLFCLHIKNFSEHACHCSVSNLSANFSEQNLLPMPAIRFLNEHTCKITMQACFTFTDHAHFSPNLVGLKYVFPFPFPSSATIQIDDELWHAGQTVVWQNKTGDGLGKVKEQSRSSPWYI